MSACKSNAEELGRKYVADPRSGLRHEKENNAKESMSSVMRRALRIP